MSTITRFEDLEAWQAGRELAKRVYAATRQAAFARDFALRDQIRRAVISITSNIAEGFERDGRGELIQFLSQGKGSAGETRSQLYHALDEHYVSEPEFEELRVHCISVSNLIAGLMRYLRQSEYRGRKYSDVVREESPSDEQWQIDGEALRKFMQDLKPGT
jgi:four helix bundle protein